MEAIARALRAEPAESFASLEAFWARHLQASAPFTLPVDRAISGGSIADRTGYAFAAGYAAALQALFPDVAASVLGSLAATEEGGAHPRAIHTTLSGSEDGLRLEGDKSWVTLGGSVLFVLARAGTSPDGRAELVVVRIPAEREGVEVVPMPELPFVPEIPHAQLQLRQVRVHAEEVLPGDGWERWVKPFRTVEDLHVHAAVLAFCLATGARLDWPRTLREQLAALLVAVRALAVEEPHAPAVHLALAGVLAQSRSLLEALAPHWAAAPEPLRSRWARDQRLLDVAQKARAARTEKAWRR